MISLEEIKEIAKKVTKENFGDPSNETIVERILLIGMNLGLKEAQKVLLPKEKLYSVDVSFSPTVSPEKRETSLKVLNDLAKQIVERL